MTITRHRSPVFCTALLTVLYLVTFFSCSMYCAGTQVWMKVVFWICGRVWEHKMYSTAYVESHMMKSRQWLLVMAVVSGITTAVFSCLSLTLMRICQINTTVMTSCVLIVKIKPGLCRCPCIVRRLIFLCTDRTLSKPKLLITVLPCFANWTSAICC